MAPRSAVGPYVTPGLCQAPLGGRRTQVKTQHVNAYVPGSRARSHSSSPLLTKLIEGPPIRGFVLGPHLLRFGDYAVSLTAPGEPRMPNGIECTVRAGPRTRVVIGGGRLIVGKVDLDMGQEWNPVPAMAPGRTRPPGPAPLVAVVAAESESDLRSAAAATLAGYVAGLVLLHGSRARAAGLARSAALVASPLDATLLRHAARGEVPEPVHALLLRADPLPLLAAGRPGGWWMRGLVSAGFPLEDNLAFVGHAPRVLRSR